MARPSRWALLLPLACAHAAGADQIDRAFNRLYNFDFPAAHAAVDEYVSAHPDDPMGYSVRSSVYVFYELNRLGILEAEFFADDKRLTDKKKLSPDPLVRRKFYEAVEAAQSRALATLSARPDDFKALYALCVTHGVVVDYVALIDKKHFSSLSTAKRSNGCAQRLLKAHPDTYDAYVTTGFTEYLVGSLPFFIRWLVRFDMVKGSKEEGIRNLREAAEKGRYLKPFAKILLALIYLREKKPQECRRYLTEFARDYPENPLVQKELAKLTARLPGWSAGQK